MDYEICFLKKSDYDMFEFQDRLGGGRKYLTLRSASFNPHVFELQAERHLTVAKRLTEFASKINIVQILSMLTGLVLDVQKLF